MRVFTAKTNARINKITASIAKPYQKLGGGSCYIFCEDKNTLSLESEISSISNLGLGDEIAKTGGSFNITVTSLSRYLKNSNLKYKTLSKTGSVLVVFKIMQENEDKLNKLKICSNPQLAKNVYELIAQLKSAKVTPETLLSASGEVSDAFSLKLRDITLIYQEYENYLTQNGVFDNNKLYSMLPGVIKTDPKLKNAKIIISGFSSVTKQIMDCFKAFCENYDVDFVLLKGSGSYYLNETYNAVTGQFKDLEIREDFLPPCDHENVIEEYLFNPEKKSKVGVYNDKVHIFECQNPYEEIKLVAKQIRQKVVKENKRYRDFCIAINDQTGLDNIFKEVFAEYEIPYYIDERQNFFNHPIMRAIISIIDAVCKNMRIDSIFCIARQRMLFGRADAENFEKYVLQNAISSKQLKSNFDVVSIEDMVADKTRDEILKLIRAFPKKATTKEYVLAIKENILTQKIFDNLASLGKLLEKDNEAKIALFSQAVMKNIDSVLSDIVNIVGEKVVKIEEFKGLIISAFTSSEISILPMYNDNVYIGDYKSVKQRNCDYLFAIGLSSDVPSAKKDIAILTDKDLLRLDKMMLEIEPKIQIVNKREKENVSVCLMGFNKGLYLSYSLRGVMSEQTQKSEIIDYLSLAFNTPINSISDAQGLGLFDEQKNRYLAKKQAIRRFCQDCKAYEQGDDSLILGINGLYNAQKDSLEIGEKLTKIISPKEVVKFSGQITESLSASAIETYFKCPYSCFLKYNLRLSRDEKGEVESLSFGLIMHSVLENFVNKIAKVKNEDTVADTAIQIFNDIINGQDYVKYLHKPKYVAGFEILKKEAIKMCKQVYGEYKNSSFVPLGEELSFGFIKDSKYPAIEIKTHKGKKYLSGVVDRVDKFGNHIRIIDYKTGGAKEKADNNKFYSGINIQLYLYANAFLKEGELAGAYYYSVENKYKNPQDSVQSFYGNTVFSDEIINASDINFEENGKQSAPFGIKQSRGETKGSFLSQSEMKSFVKYAKAVATSGADEMAEGNIWVSPAEHACEYCDYKGICGFNEMGGDQIRVVKDITNQTIVGAVENVSDELDNTSIKSDKS